MRRVNIRAAFVGEPSHGSESSAAEESDEAVALVVRGGEVTIVVPQGTPDEQVVGAASTLRGTLHLENERVLSFEIQDGAVGAFFEDEAAHLHYRRQESSGLFSLSAGRFELSGGPVRARDLMRTALVTATPDMPVQEVAELLAFHNITGMPVMQGDEVVGVVTEADVIGKQGRTVGEIMTSEVVSVAEDTPAEEVANLLTQRRIRRVPIMRDKQLIGIVTRGDIVRWVAGRGGVDRRSG
jgi:CBS domain-containing protein